MTETEIKQKLTSVFRDVFDNPTIELSDTMTAADIEGWDSISNITLMVAVEKAFGARFTTKEVRNLGNVGDFIQLIVRRIA